MSGPSPAGWYRRQALDQWKWLDLGAIAALAEAFVKVECAGRRVYVMGNGDPAAMAAHVATDLTKTASVPRWARLRCLSLSDNLPLITVIADDISFSDQYGIIEDMRLGLGHILALFLRQQWDCLRRR